MLPSGLTNINYIAYDIAEISSFDKTHTYTQCNVMNVGNNCSGFKSRILIKFNFNLFPKNVQISKAILTVNIISCNTTNQLLGYTLNSEWDINTVNWNNQPSINFSNRLLKKSVYNCKKCYFDITNQIRMWHKYPHLNYGMILMSSEKSHSNKIYINTEQGTNSCLSLLVKYCITPNIITPTQFFEYREDVQVSPGKESYTTGRNISLMNRYSYFIKNNSNSNSITVISENSPDDVNYSKEIQTIIIPPNSSSLLVPINFSKFIRLSIMLQSHGYPVKINTWLNLQQ